MLEDIKRQICEVMRMLYLKNLITSLAGNISVRVDNRVLMTPSRKLKFLLEPNDIVVLDLETGQIIEGPKPSIEMNMHLEIYRRRPDIKAVVHVHGVLAPVMWRELLSELDAVKDVEYELLGINICVVERLPPGSIELAYAVATNIEKGCSVAILDGHGLVAVGRDLAEAIERVEYVENMFKRALAKTLLNH